MRETSTPPPTTPWEGFLQWCTSLSWGDVPGWAGLILAGIAAVVALVTYRHSVTVRTEAQARLVYATRDATKHLAAGDGWDVGDEMGVTFQGMTTLVGPPRLAMPGVQVRVAVHNGSDEPLPQGVVRVLDFGLKKPASAWATFGVVPPRDSRAQWILFPDVHGHPNAQGAYSVYLAFQDSSGRWWERDEGGIIRRLRRDPSPRRGA